MLWCFSYTWVRKTYLQSVLLSNLTLWAHLRCIYTFRAHPIPCKLCGVVYMYVCRFQNIVLHCPIPRLHCFLSFHWPSFRFLSFMTFLIPSIQFFFSLPHALFRFSIHFSALLGNLPSSILWTWPYHVSWFYSISFIMGSCNPVCCLIVTFLILSFLDILEDLLRASISVASICLLLFSVSLHDSEP